MIPEHRLKGLVAEDSEMALVSAAIQNPDLLDQPFLSCDLFESKDASKYLEAMSALRDAGKPVTPLSISQELKDEEAHDLLVGLVGRYRGVESEVTLLADELKELALRRSGARACLDGYHAIIDRQQPAIDSVSKLEDNVFRLSTPGGSGAQDGSNMKKVIEDVQWRHNHPGQIRGLSTGFPELDSLTDGLKPKQLVLLGGRPSSGKSALGKDVQEHLLLQGKRVVTVTLEMTTEECQQRQLASLARVPLGVMRKTPFTEAELKALSDATGRMKNMQWKIFDEARSSINDIRAKIRRLFRSWPFELLVIDYLQLVKGTKPGDQRRLEVSEVSGSLKELAKDLGIPILALCQLKRVGTIFDKDSGKYITPPPKLEDLMESASLEQDADTVWLLHREQTTNATTGEIRLAKQRSGPLGIVAVEFIPYLTKFREY